MKNSNDLYVCIRMKEVRYLCYDKVSLLKRTIWYMFTELGWDIALAALHMCSVFVARSWLDQDYRKDMLKGGLSSKDFFLRPVGYTNKPNAYQWCKRMMKEFFFFWLHAVVKILTHCWQVIGLGYFWLNAFRFQRFSYSKVLNLQ